MDTQDEQNKLPAAEAAGRVEGKAAEKHPSDVALEGGWQMTLDYINSGKAAAKKKLAQDDVLLQDHPALSPEAQQVYAARSLESQAELDALADQILQKVQAEWRMAEQPAAAPEKVESQPAPVPAESVDLESSAEREQACAALKKDMGVLGARILEAGGELDDKAKKDLAALGEKIFEFYQAVPDSAAQDAQRVWAHLNEALYANSADAASRAAALRIFFKAQPKLAPQDFKPDVVKAPAQQDVPAKVSGDVVGSWLPEKDLEKGTAAMGQAAEKGIVKATDALAKLMGGGI
jgi:hypothetical protein